MRRTIVLALAAIILPGARETAADPTDVHTFVERAARRFALPPVKLVTLDEVRQGQIAYYRHGRRAGKINVSARLYDSPFRFEIVAHELGHHLQGPPTLKRLSPRRADREREQYEREIDASVRAVAILVRVEDISEQEAVARMHRLLLSLHAAQVRDGTPTPFGHKDRCTEAADLLARFPQYREQLAQPCPL